jgi:CBS domain-containing protein
MRLTDVLAPEHIVVPLKVETAEEAAAVLLGRMASSGAVTDPDALREEMGDERSMEFVRVGGQVLLPHYRSDHVRRVVAGIGIAPHPLRVRDGAQREDDAVGAQVLILVLAPRTRAQTYLQVVGAFARALRKEGALDALREARSPRDVLALPAFEDITFEEQLTVRDVMTRRVYRVYPQTPVSELVDLMRRHRLRAVPVVGEKREVLGLVTDRDLLRYHLPRLRRGEGGEAGGREEPSQQTEDPVKRIMSRSVMCISEDDTLAEVASVMINKDVERFPVVREGRLTGFLTRGDLIRKLIG